MYLYNNAERTHCCVYIIKRSSCILLIAILDSTVQRKTHCIVSIVTPTRHKITLY